MKSYLRFTIAAILGIELGILTTVLVFISMIGYLFTGILAYILQLITPFEHEEIAPVTGVAIAAILTLSPIPASIAFSKKYFKYYPIATIVGAILCTVILYQFEWK